MRISVLDQSPIPEGSTGADALHNTLDLAQLTERLGYHRYWVAEHHGGPMLAGAAPEVLISAIAAVTKQIRVGSGGVMLPHYSPFKVAETFTILAGLYGERIDLALGRASGTDPLTTFALQRDRRQASPDDFPQQLVELLGYLNGTLPDEFPFKRLADVLPGGPARPVPWLLGSSPQSAIWAAELGLPYAFADFIAPQGESITADYMKRFAPTAGLTGPAVGRVAVAVWVICAESDEQARYLSSSSRMTMRMLRNGTPIAVPAPDRATAWLRSQGERVDGWIPGRRAVIGTPAFVRSELERIAAEYAAEEVIVVTITHQHQARRRSYELVAEAFDLTPAGAAAL